jgi:hypothetical protein
LPGVTKEKIYKKFWVGLSGKLLLALASTILISGPVETHDHIFVFLRLLRVLKWGFLSDERNLTTAGHSSTGADQNLFMQYTTLHRKKILLARS